MYNTTFISVLVIFIGLLACKEQPVQSDLQDLDLMRNGLPIKIKAPENPDIQVRDMGFVKDVSVKSGDNFYIQIVAGTATTTNIARLKEKLMNEARDNPFFAQIVEEDDNGFIFEKKISEERGNFDFRYVRVQGDQEYTFQTGLIGTFSLSDVQRMYSAVKR